MTPRPTLALGTAALLAGLALVSARADNGPVSDPRAVEPGTYSVEPMHTRVLFAVSHFGFTTYYGEFTSTSGTLTLSPEDPAASRLEVRVATDSVSVPSEKLEGELKGDQWLDAAKFPDLSFKSDKVTMTGPNTATVAGDLTLHGVTHPVTMTARFNAAGINPADKKYTIGFEVSGTIDRTAFGVKTYAPYIGSEVTLMISAAFEKQT